MPIQLRKVEPITKAFLEIFGAVAKTTGYSEEGTVETVSAHVDRDVEYEDIEKLLVFRAHEGVPHRFRLKRSGTGITVIFS